MQSNNFWSSPKNRIKDSLNQVFPLLHEPQQSAPEVNNASSSVKVQLRDILPTLSKALEKGHTWVEDFSDDWVRIPTDLRDIINAIKEIQNRD